MQRELSSARARCSLRPAARSKRTRSEFGSTSRAGLLQDGARLVDAGSPCRSPPAPSARPDGSPPVRRSKPPARAGKAAAAGSSAWRSHPTGRRCARLAAHAGLAPRSTPWCSRSPWASGRNFRHRPAEAMLRRGSSLCYRIRPEWPICDRCYSDFIVDTTPGRYAAAAGPLGWRRFSMPRNSTNFVIASHRWSP